MKWGCCGFVGGPEVLSNITWTINYLTYVPCDYATLTPSRTIDIMPDQWDLTSSDPTAAWQIFLATPEDPVDDAQGHTDPSRLWYTSTNLTQDNYRTSGANHGNATSPAVTATAGQSVYFSSRYDIESRDPHARDLMRVFYKTTGSWTLLCVVNPSTSPQGTPDKTVCSNGSTTGQYPCATDATGAPHAQWESRSVRLPISGASASVQLRLSFDTVDDIQNAGTGWMVTDVRIA